MTPVKPWKQIEIPLYGGQLLVYRDKAKMCKALEAFRCEAEVGSEAGSCVALDHVSPVAYLVGWYDKSPATLVHELAHASIFVFKRADIDPTDSQGEAFAYLLGHLADQLL